MGSTVKGVGVDSDAVSKHDPVTVVITPEGRELDADTWSDANNYVAAGCAFKAGFPTFPGDESHQAHEAPTARPSSTQRSGQVPVTSTAAQPATPAASA